MTDSAPDLQSIRIRRFEINICQGCLDLRGEACNTPACIFCRQSTAEISHYLDVLLIRPIIDGTQLKAIIPEEAKCQTE